MVGGKQKPDHDSCARWCTVHLKFESQSRSWNRSRFANRLLHPTKAGTAWPKNSEFDGTQLTSTGDFIGKATPHSDTGHQKGMVGLRSAGTFHREAFFRFSRIWPPFRLGQRLPLSFGVNLDARGWYLDRRLRPAIGHPEGSRPSRWIFLAARW